MIGQDGKSIEGLKKQLEKLVNAGIKKDSKNRKTIQINVVEVANPNLDARLVARWIANELEQRRASVQHRKKRSRIQCVLELRVLKLLFLAA